MPAAEHGSRILPEKAYRLDAPPGAELRRAARPFNPSRNPIRKHRHVMQQLLLHLSEAPAQTLENFAPGSNAEVLASASRLACRRGGGTLRLPVGSEWLRQEPSAARGGAVHRNGAGRTLLLGPRARARSFGSGRTAAAGDRGGRRAAAHRGRAGNAVPPIPAAARGRRARARGGRRGARRSRLAR